MNVKKIILKSVIAGSFLLGTIAAASPTYASSAKQVSVEINGIRQSLSQPPILTKGTTLVPMRVIFEQLGAHILWNPETLTIVATKSDKTIELQIGNDQGFINGKAVNLGSPTKMMNNTTMVPLRFVSEALGASVAWDQKQLKVSIHSK